MLASLALAWLLGCAPPEGGRATPGHPDTGANPAAPTGISRWGSLEGPGVPRGASEPVDSGETGEPADPLVTEESVGDWSSPVFSDDVVMQIEITLAESAMDALRADPDAFVEGSVTADGHTWSPVGVRLKGSASWQPIDDKANFKIKLEDYTDERFYGLDRLTLQNNIWDPSMMAQDLAYRFFRAAGVPAPRTGYAWVTVNGTDKGLYTILESMDGQFVDREFPGSEGNLYEMTRECDFTGDGSCYELQVEGEAEPDPDNALKTATDAVHAADLDALRDAFQWEDLIAFLAVERVINHPDSYSYNLNNYFVYHDPVEDRVSLIPWGADSTFVYTYPPDVEDYACEASAYLDVLASSPHGWLGGFCQGDAGCWEDLSIAMHDVANLLLSSDLAGYAAANRERIRDYVEADPLVTYEPEHFEQRVDCFIEWIEARPDEIEAWLAD